jgi:2-amino-4-hydroxy-6-hydroxymethyldihydropteridine diphosphokinase
MVAAARMLQDAFSDEVVRFSHLYRSPPIGGPAGQGDFLNAVAAVETNRDPFAVWGILREIEISLGRQRSKRWEARRIDADVILHGSQRIWTPHFKVPHPRMCMRAFVLEPARQLVPGWTDPVTGWSLEALADYWHRGKTRIVLACDDPSQLHELRTCYAEQPDWLACFASQDIQAALLEVAEPRLLVVATRNPNPEIVHWEDSSRSWARKLHLCEDSTGALPIDWVGPRYLVSSSDPVWVRHELDSAWAATHCSVEHTTPLF